MKLQWDKDLKSGDLSGVHAECLTDTWIGKDRWAFIDLSAGPFSWGPAVGGEGVRTELSLPNVEKTIGAVAGNKLLPEYRKFPNCSNILSFCWNVNGIWMKVGLSWYSRL